jgi:hypothetical protein
VEESEGGEYGSDDESGGLSGKDLQKRVDPLDFRIN